jgi:hypothetical protein
LGPELDEGRDEESGRVGFGVGLDGPNDLASQAV